MSEQSLQDGMESGSKVTGHDLDKTKEERRKERWRRKRERKMKKKEGKKDGEKRGMERTKNIKSE